LLKAVGEGTVLKATSLWLSSRMTNSESEVRPKLAS
jgi:hypothetical protein